MADNEALNNFSDEQFESQEEFQTHDEGLRKNDFMSELLNVDLFDKDLLLLILILFIFFQKKKDFSKQINALNQDLSAVKDHLNIAESALQSLNSIIDLSDSIA